MDTSKWLEDNSLDSGTVPNRKAGHFTSAKSVLPRLTHGRRWRDLLGDKGTIP